MEQALMFKPVASTRALLPDFYEDVPKMKKLCAVCDGQINAFYAAVNEVFRLLSVCEQEEILSRWEALLKLTYMQQPGTDGVSLSSRSALIGQFLFSAVPITIRSLQDFLSRVCTDYTIRYDASVPLLYLSLSVPSSAQFGQIKDFLETVLPAHLQLKIESIIPQHKNRAALTHLELSALTHGQLHDTPI